MGCSGGDTEGELEKGTKKYGRWATLAIVGTVTTVIGLSFGTLWGGTNSRYNAYHDGVHRGHIETEAEAQEQAPKVKLQLVPMIFHGGDVVTDTFFSAEQTMRDDQLIYILQVSPGRIYSGEIGEDPHIDKTDIIERLYIERADGTGVSYYDGDIDVQVNGDSCRAGPRDGLVDSISAHQPGKGFSLLCRERDYDANPTVFESADVLFQEVRAQYFDSE